MYNTITITNISNARNVNTIIDSIWSLQGQSSLYIQVKSKVERLHTIKVKNQTLFEIKMSDLELSIAANFKFNKGHLLVKLLNCSTHDDRITTRRKYTHGDGCTVKWKHRATHQLGASY